MFAELHQMAATIYPEANPNIVAQPDAWPTPIHCSAYCVPTITATMREYLQSAGAWTEPRPLIVMVDPTDDSAASRGIFIHELAHIPGDLEQPAETPITADRRFRQDAEFAYLALTPIITDEPPWAGHDAAFIRRALHLHHRAVGHGWALGVRDLSIAGLRYGLSSAFDYWLAIGDEPLRCESMLLAEIEQLPPPADFASLWERDQAAYYTHARKENA
ncbi:hypothetical protein [Lacipirellula parvula]|uniref:Uncharacterized protein n=1 Tax=Lacipirellula parvula TaxID=2650471 RepID=A0A5K7XFF5_9BACT|nr:hypothetical protein [Lacipirellula parvula]BBO34732.1 hypothetical protein PLANPX_4344 [Lacipirellula parvula]